MMPFAVWLAPREATSILPLVSEVVHDNNVGTIVQIIKNVSRNRDS